MAAIMGDLLKKLPKIPAIMDLGDSIIRWANPDLDAQNAVTKDWPLARLDHAAIIVGAFLVWVLFGLFLKKMAGSKSTPDKPEGKSSVLQKISAEPIVLIQMLYNPCQVLLCGYMIKEAILEYRQQNYSPICNPFLQGESGMARVLWVFYVSKVFDFFDTFFIVLRGKWSKLSFLHVYHHASIFLFYWLNINAGYDGDIYYTIILNSFIHMVMYSYYLATSFSLPVPKPLKQLVTQSQMIQFVTMMAQALYILYFGCPYPRRITQCYLVYILSLFILFQNFSDHEYKKEAKGAKPSGKKD